MPTAEGWNKPDPTPGSACLTNQQYVPRSTMSRIVSWMRSALDRRLNEVDFKPREK
jgi:hypothetical protein